MLRVVDRLKDLLRLRDQGDCEMRSPVAVGKSYKSPE